MAHKTDPPPPTAEDSDNDWASDLSSELTDLEDLEDELEAFVQPPAPPPPPQPTVQPRVKPPSTTAAASTSRPKRVAAAKSAATTANATGRGKKKAQAEYRPRKGPSKPVMNSVQVESIYSYIEKGKIDMDIDYQRDVVWKDKQMIGLIDTLIKDFYMPPIIISIRKDETGYPRWRVVDGKQRLTSIQRFINCEFAYKDPDNNQKYWFEVPKGAGPTAKALPDGVRQEFLEQQVFVIQYQEPTDESEREVFQRVQNGVPLTTADKMQAIIGPWPEYIRAAIRHVPSLKSILGKSGRVFHCVMAIVYFAEKGEKTWPAPTTLARWLERVRGPTKALQEVINSSCAVLHEIISDGQYGDVLVCAPMAECVAAGVFVRKKMDTLSLTQLASAIVQMRAKNKKDVKSDTKSLKYMLDIFERLPVKGLATDGNGDLCGYRAVMEEDVIQGTAGQPAQRKKRKRVSRDLDSDDESEAPPPAKAKKTTTTKTKPVSAAPVPSSSKTTTAKSASTEKKPKSRVAPTSKAGASTAPTSAINGLPAGKIPRKSSLVPSESASTSAPRKSSVPSLPGSREASMGPPISKSKGSPLSLAIGSALKFQKRRASGQLTSQSPSGPSSPQIAQSSLSRGPTASPHQTPTLPSKRPRLEPSSRQSSLTPVSPAVGHPQFHSPQAQLPASPSKGPSKASSSAPRSRKQPAADGSLQEQQPRQKRQRQAPPEVPPIAVFGRATSGGPFDTSDRRSSSVDSANTPVNDCQMLPKYSPVNTSRPLTNSFFPTVDGQSAPSYPLNGIVVPPLPRPTTSGRNRLGNLMKVGALNYGGGDGGVSRSPEGAFPGMHNALGIVDAGPSRVAQQQVQYGIPAPVGPPPGTCVPILQNPHAVQQQVQYRPHPQPQHQLTAPVGPLPGTAIPVLQNPFANVQSNTHAAPSTSVQQVAAAAVPPIESIPPNVLPPSVPPPAAPNPPAEYQHPPVTTFSVPLRPPPASTDPAAPPTALSIANVPTVPKPPSARSRKAPPKEPAALRATAPSSLGPSSSSAEASSSQAQAEAQAALSLVTAIATSTSSGTGPVGPPGPSQPVQTTASAPQLDMPATPVTPSESSPVQDVGAAAAAGSGSTRGPIKIDFKSRKRPSVTNARQADLGLGWDDNVNANEASNASTPNAGASGGGGGATDGDKASRSEDASLSRKTPRTPSKEDGEINDRRERDGERGSEQNRREAEERDRHRGNWRDEGSRYPYSRNSTSYSRGRQ